MFSCFAATSPIPRNARSGSGRSLYRIIHVLVLEQPRPLLLRLDDRRELQSRLSGSADQPLFRQPGRPRRPRAVRGGPLGRAVCSSVVALVGRLVTIPLPIPFLGDIAFLIGLAGLFTLLCGTAALKRYWFAFFFLIFMVPLPVALYSKIASPLQLLASRVASTVMNATGVPVLCEGNRMTLPGRPPDVCRRGLQRHETVDRVSGLDDGRGLLDHAAGLVPRRHHHLGVADRAVGEHRPGDADRLHHAFRQSAVRPGDVPHARRLADDGLWTALAPLRVLDPGSGLPDRRPSAGTEAPKPTCPRRGRSRSAPLDATPGRDVRQADPTVDSASMEEPC